MDKQFITYVENNAQICHNGVCYAMYVLSQTPSGEQLGEYGQGKVISLEYLPLLEN